MFQTRAMVLHTKAHVPKSSNSCMRDFWLFYSKAMHIICFNRLHSSSFRLSTKCWMLAAGICSNTDAL